MNSEVKNCLKNDMGDLLNPIDVLKLFERIPVRDIPLLSMNNDVYVFLSWIPFWTLLKKKTFPLGIIQVI